ncbi:MAG: hypothetical protein ACI82A_004173 [Candidatus Azotimanducaceae bacterium]
MWALIQSLGLHGRPSPSSPRLTAAQHYTLIDSDGERSACCRNAALKTAFFGETAMLIKTLPVISNAMDDVPTSQTVDTSGDNTCDDHRGTHRTLAHDFAMAFLPLEILDKQKKLSKKSLKVMRTHISSAAELIHRMQGCNESREIIMAHDEHFDGQGYPNQLTDFEINPGAKLLAIVDAFVARSSNTMQAIMEINRYSDTQFDPIWVEHFNVAIKKIRSSQQQLSEKQPKTS